MTASAGHWADIFAAGLDIIARLEVVLTQRYAAGRNRIESNQTRFADRIYKKDPRTAICPNAYGSLPISIIILEEVISVFK